MKNFLKSPDFKGYLIAMPFAFATLACFYFNFWFSHLIGDASIVFFYTYAGGAWLKQRKEKYYKLPPTGMKDEKFTAEIHELLKEKYRIKYGEQK